jgi:hypothetical protein
MRQTIGKHEKVLIKAKSAKEFAAIKIQEMDELDLSLVVKNEVMKLQAPKAMGVEKEVFIQGSFSLNYLKNSKSVFEIKSKADQSRLNLEYYSWEVRASKVSGHIEGRHFVSCDLNIKLATRTGFKLCGGKKTTFSF